MNYFLLNDKINLIKIILIINLFYRAEWIEENLNNPILDLAKRYNEK
jgi:hypothetical protein